MMTAVEVRPLRSLDLDAVEEIEQRSYPTPWSRAMFAGELSKPTASAWARSRARRCSGT
jgi:hypothetical protein